MKKENSQTLHEQLKHVPKIASKLKIYQMKVKSLSWCSLSLWKTRVPKQVSIKRIMTRRCAIGSDRESSHHLSKIHINYPYRNFWLVIFICIHFFNFLDKIDCKTININCKHETSFDFDQKVCAWETIICQNKLYKYITKLPKIIK